jgi:hypothetical protein
MNVHLMPKTPTFRVVNLCNSTLLPAIPALNLNALAHKQPHSDITSFSLGVEHVRNQ